MKYIVALSIILLPLLSIAQDCNCTTAQVESNTVEFCDVTIGDIVSDENILSAGSYTFVSEGPNGCKLLSDFVINDPIELLKSYFST